MAELHLDPNSIKPIIQAYSAVNGGFVFKNYTGTDSKKTCTFSINGKECKVDIFIKKNSVNIVATGKNKEEANLLIEHISNKGFSANAETKTIIIKCSQEIVNELLAYIDGEYKDKISYIDKGNSSYRFEGFNKDYLTFNFYNTGKATLQGRPYYVYNAILVFLSNLDDFSFEDIININNKMTSQTTPFTVIRDLIKVKVENAYSYLDEALLKSISGSLSQQNQETVMEDYSGCLMGVFKALEGYLKKLLTQRFGYTLRRNDNFFMFKFENGNSEIESNSNISQLHTEQLLKLYNLYKSKRNTYSHATVDPSQTSIIEKKDDAIEISDEILRTIKESYNIIFGA